MRHNNTYIYIYIATPDRYTDIYIGYSVILYIIYLLHNSTIGKNNAKNNGDPTIGLFCNTHYLK